MTTPTDRAAAATRPGITPAELAVMRHAAARISPAASGNPSAPDPFTALTRPFTPGPPGRPEWWHKQQGHSHYCF